MLILLKLVWDEGAAVQCRAVADRHGILDLDMPVALEAGPPGSANGAPGAQMVQQFLRQNLTRMDVQAFVDGFVRHLPVRGLERSAPELPYDLFRRPFGRSPADSVQASGGE